MVREIEQSSQAVRGYLSRAVHASRDYAIVARFRDPMTGSMMTEIGGRSLHGTQSASEFVTDPKYLNALCRNGSLHRENFQAGMKIQVINGRAGSPENVVIDE